MMEWSEDAESGVKLCNRSPAGPVARKIPITSSRYWMDSIMILFLVLGEMGWDFGERGLLQVQFTR